MPLGGLGGWPSLGPCHGVLRRSLHPLEGWPVGRVSHLVAEAPGETCITKRSFSNLLSRRRDLLTRGTWPHLVAPALRASVSRWRTGLHGRSLHLVTSEGPSPYSGSWDERQRLPSHLILLARLRASTTKTKPQVQRPGEREGRQTCAVGQPDIQPLLGKIKRTSLIPCPWHYTRSEVKHPSAVGGNGSRTREKVKLASEATK